VFFIFVSFVNILQTSKDKTYNAAKQPSHEKVQKLALCPSDGEN
jgi:hypothetical protein